MTKELIQTIFARRSIRKYTAEPVREEDVRTLLEAAMAAPSSSNRKPWHFVVVDDRETLDALAEVHPYGKMLFEATLCIAVCGDPTITERVWVQDCSAATENLLLAVTALGLGAVWLGVHPREERVAAISEVLNPNNENPALPFTFNVAVSRHDNVYHITFQGAHQNLAVDHIETDNLIGTVDFDTRINGINYYAVETLNIDLGSGDDVFNVQGTSATTNLSLHNGDERIYVLMW